MFRRASAVVLVVGLPMLAGCRAKPLADDQLSVDEEEWVLEVDAKFQRYDKARRGGLVDDQNTAKHELMRIAEEQRELLVKALRCNDWRGRMVAAATLGFGLKDDVIGLMVEALQDPDTLVRMHALYGIAVKASDQTPMPPLIAQLGDPDAEIRVVALGAISKVVRRNTDKGAMPRVVELLSDPDWRVRCQALTVIGAVARKDTITAVVEKGIRDENSEVRMYAVGALFNIHIDDVVNPLIGAMTDPDQRVADTAQRALETLSGQKFGSDPEKWQGWWTHRQDLGLGLEH